MEIFEKKQEASITVEAAFIIPVVIFVTLALIYLTFYLHDRVRVEEIAEKALGQGNFLAAQRAGMEGDAFDFMLVNQKGNWGYLKDFYQQEEVAMTEYLREQMEQGLFLLKAETVSCKIDGFSVVVKIEAKGKISWSPIKNFWSEAPGFIIERRVPVHKPEEVMRAYEGLQVIMDDTGSFEFVKEHIGNLKNVTEKE